MFVVGIYWLGSISDKTWESKLVLFRSYEWDDSAILTTRWANLISLKVSEVERRVRPRNMVYKKLIMESYSRYTALVEMESEFLEQFCLSYFVSISAVKKAAEISAAAAASLKATTDGSES
ncbi:hypothetical protein Drorol1_Dr00026561 [Drosera rotundifolia]